MTLAFIQLLSLWCIDVSTSTLIMKNNMETESDVQVNVYMSDGFFTHNSLITYPLGHYVLVITCFLSAPFTLYLIFQPYRSEKHPSQ